ncbi:MAG: hypothetical protein GXO69_00655 [Acidobacteria bacterium]|nr:hypothetical protein [Acidobacteriota bacterium]
MKKLVLVLIVMLGIVPVVRGAASDDYKVIKKAVKPGTTAVTTMDEVKWFKVEVTDMTTGKVKVRITLPISLLDVVSGWCPNNSMDFGNGMKIKLKQLLVALKKAGPLAIVEACEDNEKVRVWVE